MQPGTVGSYVVTDDPDPVHARAVAAGAEIADALHETEHGSRDFAVRNPHGSGEYVAARCPGSLHRPHGTLLYAMVAEDRAT
jgi:hypothetical protein